MCDLNRDPNPFVNKNILLDEVNVANQCAEALTFPVETLRLLEHHFTISRFGGKFVVPPGIELGQRRILSTDLFRSWAIDAFGDLLRAISELKKTG